MLRAQLKGSTLPHPTPLNQWRGQCSTYSIEINPVLDVVIQSEVEPPHSLQVLVPQSYTLQQHCVDGLLQGYYSHDTNMSFFAARSAGLLH